MYKGMISIKKMTENHPSYIKKSKKRKWMSSFTTSVRRGEDKLFLHDISSRVFSFGNSCVTMFG